MQTQPVAISNPIVQECSMQDISINFPNSYSQLNLPISLGMIHRIATLLPLFSKEFSKNGFQNLKSLYDAISFGNPCNLTISLKNNNNFRCIISLYAGHETSHFRESNNH